MQMMRRGFTGDARTRALRAQAAILRNNGVPVDASGRVIVDGKLFREHVINMGNKELAQHVAQYIQDFRDHGTFLAEKAVKGSKEVQFNRGATERNIFAESLKNDSRHTMPVDADGVARNALFQEKNGRREWRPQQDIKQEHTAMQRAMFGIVGLLPSLPRGSKEMGKTFKSDNTPIVYGAVMPDAFYAHPSIPQYLKTHVQGMEDAIGRGGTMVMDWLQVGSRQDGAYKVDKLIANGSSRTSEVRPFGMSINKKGMMLAHVLEMEQVYANFSRAFKNPEVQRIFKDEADMVDTLNKVLDNHTKGLAGDFQLGGGPDASRAKYDWINAATGLYDLRRNRDKNPVAAENKFPSAVKTPRMDRVMALREGNPDGFKVDYEKWATRAMPDTPRDAGDAQHADLEARYKAGDASALEEARALASARTQEAGNGRSGWHGTGAENFYEFSSEKSGGRGFYFSKKKEYAGSYAKGDSSRIIEAFLDVKNPIRMEDFLKYGTDAGLSKAEAVKQAKADGFDGIEGAREIVAFSPNQIKSADPFTYDDNGRLIPLSERFNAGSKDIRFMPDSRATNEHPIRPMRNGGMTTAPGIVNIGDVRALPAYHGTPHEIPAEEGFRLDKIGTGEGAQAYGHGLYFAGDRKVAETYKKALSGFDELTLHTAEGKKKGPTLDDVDLEVAKYLEAGERAAGQFKHNTVYYAKQQAEAAGRQDVVERLDRYGRDAKVGYEKNNGTLFTVDLDVKPDELLDWDIALAEQPAQVRKALQKVIGGKVSPDGLDMGGGAVVRDNRNGKVKPSSSSPWVLVTGESMFDLSQKDVDRMTAEHANPKGENIYTRLAAKMGGQKQASDFLNSLGIKGIRYLDGVSRGNGKGTYNYVIFDESRIKILEENGKPRKPLPSSALDSL